MTPETFLALCVVVMDPISFWDSKHHISRYTNLHATRNGEKRGQQIQLDRSPLSTDSPRRLQKFPLQPPGRDDLFLFRGTDEL